MNKELKQYNEMKNKTLTTSEVIQKSFTNVFDKLKKEEYVLVENQRKKITMVLQTIDSYTGVDTTPKSFDKDKVETAQENKLLARMFIKENVYYLMKFESPNITFPIVDKAYMARNTEFLEEFDEIVTKQLINAWKYIITTPELFSYEVLMKLHSVIAKEQALSWGVLRNGQVGISGTNFKPIIPTKKIVQDILNIKESDPYKKSMKVLIRLIKAQPFWDGNKRASFLITNKYMMDNKLGLVVVNDKCFDEFNVLLNEYYNNEKAEDKLVNFLINKCIYNSVTKKLIQ